MTVEEWVLELRKHLEQGTLLNLAGDSSDEDLGSSDPATWPSDREVPAEALRQVLLNPGRRCDARGLRLRAARVTSMLNLNHATVDFPVRLPYCVFDQPLRAQHVRGKTLDLRGVRAPRVDLTLAKLDGNLNLRDATLTSPGGPSLSLQGATISGSVVATSLTALGQIRGRGASIGGDLSLEDSRFSNEDGQALSIERINVGGSLHAHGLAATGQVRLLGAKISGQFSVERANLMNEGEHALSLDGATVGGGVFAREVHATGGFRALGATINGQLGLQNATLTSNRGAMCLDGAIITGAVFGAGLTARGEVHAVGATIKGLLDLKGSNLTNEGGYALRLRGASVDGVFFLQPAKIAGPIDLSFASLTQLILRNDSDPVLSNSPVEAVGWRLGEVTGWLRDSRRAAQLWLDRGAQAFGFTPQPWHELAELYEREGHLADATWLRYQAAKRTARSSRGLARLSGCLYKAFAGHGYYPLRAGAWLIGAVAASWLLISIAQSSFTPTDSSRAVQQGSRPAVAAARITGDTPCQDLAPNYPCFQPLAYALDTMLPAGVSTGEGVAWQPATTASRSVWIGLPVTLDGLRVFIWIMAALLVAGVTGLLRRT